MVLSKSSSLFDGSTLAGHDVVVFEKLFSLEGETALEIASHEDLDDKGQTIKLTEAPKDTPEPSKPVKTGDETTVLPYLFTGRCRTPLCCRIWYLIYP